MGTTVEKVKKRYQGLRFASVVLKILAIISIGGFTLLASGIIYSAAKGSYDPYERGNISLAIIDSIFQGFSVFLQGASIALGLYVVGGIIDVLLVIEENTRTTALLLKKRLAPDSSLNKDKIDT